MVVVVVVVMVVVVVTEVSVIDVVLEVVVGQSIGPLVALGSDTRVEIDHSTLEM